MYFLELCLIVEFEGAEKWEKSWSSPLGYTGELKRARDTAPLHRRSSTLMALDVAKSHSEASLSRKAKCYGRWDRMDGQMDCPELADNAHQLLGAEEGKAALNSMESLAASGCDGLASSVTAPTFRSPGMKANCLERRPLTYGADHSGDSSRCLGHWAFLEQQQADYWACAIPDSLPPSPDRQSPHWNPNKEYEDLLDYTYPLKPKYKLGKDPEPLFHDSGVDLDSFSLSPEGTFRSTSIYGI
ncbi:hypothetical protein CIB84_008099, partial [Bambusicola thoracicus]